ncbi:15443_t:CDS:2, partial [Racocetra persica]
SSSIKVWTQLGQLKLKTFMRVLAEKTDIGTNDYEVSTITRYQSLSGIATNLASSMSSTLTTQDASLLTPQPANSHEFQNPKVPLQELPLVLNQNHEMQEFFQRNLFMNSNIFK